MNDPKPRETQQELFEEFSDSPKKTERFQQISRSQKPILISTNTEQLIMTGILSILVLCAVFFLGVMRGKGLSAPILEPVSAPRPAQELSLPAPKKTPLAQAPVRESAAKPRAVATQPGTIPSKPYTIQLVTHRKKDLAEAEMNALRGQGFYSFLIPSGEYFQVCAGQYASKEEAKKDLSRFAAKFKDCFLRRR